MNSKSPHSTQSPSTRRPWANVVKAEARARLVRFAEIRVKHPKLSEVVAELRSLLTGVSESNIILITGATGVGKTTLSKELSTVCADLFHDILEGDTSAIPAIAVEAYVNGEHRIGFPDIYKRMLGKLMEPGVDRKMFSVVEDGRLVLNSLARKKTPTLRDAVEDGLRLRKTIVCTIDEAYQLLRFGGAAAVMDTFRSLSNSTNGVKFLLIGSFDLFDLLWQNGQSARRAVLVNFDRYHVEERADRLAWCKVVKMLQTAWPCDDVPNLAAVSDELMEACLGCVGLLKTLMLDAAALQMGDDNEKWNGIYLAKAAKANALREIIRKEIEAGEAKVRDALMGVCLWDDAKLADMSRRMEVAHA